MRVKYWLFSTPVRIEGMGKPWQSISVGEAEGIEFIDVLPGGIVLVGRTGASTVLVSGQSYGELTAEEEAKLASGALPGGSKKQAPGNAATPPAQSAKLTGANQAAGTPTPRSA